MVGAAGFRIARIRYYTPLIGAFVENILMRMAEHLRVSARRAKRAPASQRGALLDAEGRARPSAPRRKACARTSAKRTLAAKGPLIALRCVTALMTLDVWIFGRVRTGPFFVLLERTTTGASVERRLSDG